MISIVHGPKFNSACHLPLSMVTVYDCMLLTITSASYAKRACMYAYECQVSSIHHKHGHFVDCVD